MTNMLSTNVLLVLLLFFVSTYATMESLSYNPESKQWHVLSYGHPTSTLDVYYNDTVNLYGWAGLRVKRSRTSRLTANDNELWYGAGLAEGRVTALRIYQHYINNINPTNTTTYPPKVQAWVSEHIAWMQLQVTLNGQDLFWAQTGRVLDQLQGVTDGYNSMRPENTLPLQFFDMYYLNFMYDAGDLSRALNEVNNIQPPPQRLLRCSGLIKVTSDDLYMTHTTWSSYSTMLRIYKDYDFGKVRIAFAGYPGLLHSGDDWYILSNGLTVQETTNGVLDSAIYKYVIPQSVAEWIRVIVANNVGVDGESWVANYCRYNSGTYNNQYMVVNMNLYVKGMAAKDLPDGLLWVTEQMPGMCPYLDVTSVVRNMTYWQSFNRPYFPEVYVEAGTQAMYEKYGDYFSYTKYARPLIFARDAGSIETLADVQRFIRYNKWQTDPLSECPNCNPKGHPDLAIAARSDLIPVFGNWGNWSKFLSGPGAEGAIDGKIASKSMLVNGFVGSIVSGPTWDDQTPFQWSTTSPTVAQFNHIGQPDLQKFQWINSDLLFP
jgi:hypothetical protein